MKVCSRCGEFKDFSEFHVKRCAKDGHRSECKACAAIWNNRPEVRNRKVEAQRLWRIKNAERLKEIRKRYRNENEEKVKEYRKKYVKSEAGKAIRAKWKKEHRNKENEDARRWRLSHPEKVKEIAKRNREKRKEKIQNRLHHNVSSRLWSCLKTGAKAHRSWITLVGYTVEKLKKHLEKQFTGEMSWENYGSYWHIDHVVPVSAFNFEKPEDLDFKRCWALKNIQPLEAIQNISKGKSLIKPFQPSFVFKIKKAA